MHGHPILRLNACATHRATLAAALLASIAVIATASAAAKTDIMLFKNGDRLTGEVKSLDRGKVSFDTDAAGVIKVEWDDIGQLYSPATFEVALEDGERLYGSLVDTTRPSEIRLHTDTTTLDLPIGTVVRLTPIKSTLIDRMEISVDVGAITLAKANKLEQTNVGYDFGYRDEKREINFSLDGSTSSSENDPPSTRVFSNFGYRRLNGDRVWDPFGIAQFERNDESRHRPARERRRRNGPLAARHESEPHRVRRRLESAAGRTSTVQSKRKRIPKRWSRWTSSGSTTTRPSSTCRRSSRCTVGCPARRSRAATST